MRFRPTLHIYRVSKLLYILPRLLHAIENLDRLSLHNHQSHPPRHLPFLAHYKIATMASAVAKRLQGKTVLITGASSGIGRSTAFEFARTCPTDLKLVLTARRVDTLKQIAADIVKEVGNGVKILPVQLDVSNADQVRQFVASLPVEFREIDVLVNNA